MVKAVCYKPTGRGSLEFFSVIILPVALWLLGRLSLYQKCVPGVFPGGKGGRCLRLTTLPPSCAVVMKSGNLNFLEPSGPLQACNGTALPFYSQSTFMFCVFLRTDSSFSLCSNKLMMFIPETACFLRGKH